MCYGNTQALDRAGNLDGMVNWNWPGRTSDW